MLASRSGRPAESGLVQRNFTVCSENLRDLIWGRLGWGGRHGFFCSRILNASYCVGKDAWPCLARPPACLPGANSLPCRAMRSGTGCTRGDVRCVPASRAPQGLKYASTPSGANQAARYYLLSAAVRTCRDADAARVTYMSQPRVSVLLLLQPGTLLAVAAGSVRVAVSVK